MELVRGYGTFQNVRAGRAIAHVHSTVAGAYFVPDVCDVFRADPGNEANVAPAPGAFRLCCGAAGAGMARR